MFHLHLAFPFLPDQAPEVSERYWLEGHGPMALKSPSVSDGYVQSHRIDVRATDPRPRYEGVAESWSASEQTTRDLHPLLTGPPPDFANFLDIARASWSVGHDRQIFGDTGYGGHKSLHLLHVRADELLEHRADELEGALREFATSIPDLRRLVLCVRDRSFEWFGPASIDLAVHAWTTDRASLAGCGAALDTVLSGISDVDQIVSLRADEIVMVAPTPQSLTTSE